MRLGIVIIGSLYWDPSRVRCRWRQERLNYSKACPVVVPIRYGKQSTKRGGTYTMVFSRSCSESETLGTGLVVPARAECCEPVHFIEEAEHLWAAERDVETISGICADWGNVCVLKNPQVDPQDRILLAWERRVGGLAGDYRVLPSANDEASVFDARTGLASFDWPKDLASKRDLSGFDLLLMTANKPTLANGRYPTASEIAGAWKADKGGHVMYFWNNRRYGITTFEDAQIQASLSGDPPNKDLQPTAAA